LFESYQEKANQFSFTMFSKAGQLCMICGEPVGATRTEDGVNVFHLDCHLKNWWKPIVKR
jgi:hypothetical protein